jgi:hypothetical protein
MIAETSKEVSTIDVVIKYYLKGIAFEPLFLDNIIDLSNLCFSQDEKSLGNLLVMLTKILQVEDASHEEQQNLLVIDPETGKRSVKSEFRTTL